jgi:hypothetical protein
MDGVDHYAALVVVDQVQLTPYPVEKDPSGGCRVVQRQADPSGEVVPGTERHEADQDLAETVAAVHGADRSVQAAITSGNEHRSTHVCEQALQLVPVGGPQNGQLGTRLENRADLRDRHIIGGSGIGVRDHGDGVHAAPSGDRRR